jgi:hypothetical protein
LPSQVIISYFDSCQQIRANRWAVPAICHDTNIKLKKRVCGGNLALRKWGWAYKN